MSVAALVASGLIGAAASWPLYLAGSRKLQARIAEQDKEYRSLLEAAHHNESVLDLQTEQLARLEAVETKYNRLKGRLREAGVTETYVQPVLLVGPTGVGKTSLLTSWQMPWSTAKRSASLKHTFAEVPICLKENHGSRQHFADPDITTPTHVQLMLRVHDFPGELRAQELIQQIVQRETEEVQHSTGNRSGIVLVCMFDATEASGAISARTREYYNGELFQRLRSLTFRGDAKLSRLVMVFNKVDLAHKQAKEPLTDDQLRTRCFRNFLTTFPELGAVCHQERICGVLAMLDNTLPDKIRGASAVFGESARTIADAFGLGGEVLQSLSGEAGIAPPAEVFRAVGGGRK